MADKPLAEMSMPELQALNKSLTQQIQALQARKSEVAAAFSAKQDAAQAVEAVRSLSAHKRASLKRALEVAEAEEKAAAEAQAKKK